VLCHSISFVVQADIGGWKFPARAERPPTGC